MNLQLNPEQLLALYDSLVLSSNSRDESTDRLREIKLKLNELIVSALTIVYSSETKEKLDFWIKKEEEKINQLNDDLNKLKTLKFQKSTSESSNDDGLYFPPVK